NGSFVDISDSVIDILCRYKQDTHNASEAGGILLGIVTMENNYIITKASLPNKFDKSTRRTFERDKDIAQIIINHEFSNSHGKTIYLGEWHTHPEPIPTPSAQDIKMIKEQFLNNRLNASNLFLVIIGTVSNYFAILDNDRLRALDSL
ncbi:MAG TPA: Mov34/MPN/PAD-1 family protein, partial [Cytophagaceae bacterium]